jgi:hypothetical protein
LIEANHNLLATAHNGAAQQIGFLNNQLNQFVTRRQLGSKVALFVNGVARVQKRRDVVLAKDRFNLLRRQRLFGVIAFDQIFLLEMFAQETPRVAAGGSGALFPEMDFHKSRCQVSGAGCQGGTGT